MPYDTKEKQQAWRLQNRARMKAWRDKIYKERYALIDAAKAKPCMDCGIQYPTYVMEFDHVRGTKKNNVGSLWNNVKAISKEIEKCDVVCANCHSTRTYFRRIEVLKGK